MFLIDPKGFVCLPTLHYANDLSALVIQLRTSVALTAHSVRALPNAKEND